ncbi:MAG: ferredoxin family protein [Candidatus Lokiarchaeota archaeon]
MTNLKRWEDNDQWVEVDLDKCIGAADCVDVCPVECYELDENGKVNAEMIGECIDCMACEGVCPTDAILKHSSWE